MSAKLYQDSIPFVDSLYGEGQMPSFVAELLASKTMQRLQGISLDTIPQSIAPFPLANRYDHSCGVTRLMEGAIHTITGDDDEIRLHIAGALLHDAGSPPFSHNSEVLLTKKTGCNGESFLLDMISHFGERKLFKQLGIDLEQLVLLVTGQRKPLSVLLHGTMDTDNLDNVLRYAVCGPCQEEERPYDPLPVVGSFTMTKEGVALDARCWEDVKRWKETRKRVYKFVYNDPHLSIASAVRRALDLAERAGKLNPQFFFLTDEEGLGFLESRHVHSRRIIGRLRHKEQMLYECVFGAETTRPGQDLAKRIQMDDARNKTADFIAKQAEIAPEDICVYAGIGKDVRKVGFPFLMRGGMHFTDSDIGQPIYRFKVFVFRGMPKERKQRVRALAKRLVSD